MEFFRKELFLEKLNEPNLFMTPLQRPDDQQKAKQVWKKIHGDMEIIGFTVSEVKAICTILAAIYHIGVAGNIKSMLNLVLICDWRELN